MLARRIAQQTYSSDNRGKTEIVGGCDDILAFDQEAKDNKENITSTPTNMEFSKALAYERDLLVDQGNRYSKCVTCMNVLYAIIFLF